LHEMHYQKELLCDACLLNGNHASMQFLIAIGCWLENSLMPKSHTWLNTVMLLLALEEMQYSMQF
jgi:hypothetical protein